MRLIFSQFSRIAALMLFMPMTAGAASPQDLPPPRDISSLAEQLVPFIKANPTLPDMHARPVKKKADKDAHKPTPLEQAFSRRANQDLQLFGYNQIGRHISQAPTTGQVQDDLILGAGDKVMVTFRGQRDDSKTYTISPQGELIVDGMAPITASGMTIGALRQAIEAETARNLMNSTVFLSVKALRQIAVTVMGEVQSPGVYVLSPFQTIMDALAMAKGIGDNGSLRQIKLIRNNKVVPLDFYKLLLEGDLGVSTQLRDGDKIMVPMLGQSIAVAGDVKRPAIFENRADKKFSFAEALQMAGGTVRPGANRFVKLSLDDAGDERVEDIHPGDDIIFNDGDVLMVTSGEPMRTNGIQLLGHVRQPGTQDLSQAPDLKTLLNNARVFREGIYPFIGMIERMDAKTLSPVLVGFSPTAVMQHKENLKLQERDRVMLFPTADILRVLSDKQVMRKKTDGGKTALKEASEALPELEILPQKKDDKANPLLTRQVVKFLRDHAASVSGAVIQDGLYPVFGKVSLNDMLAVAGGLRLDADKRHVEILLANPGRNGRRYDVNMNKDRPEAILISAQDRIYVGETYSVAEAQGITITGEVKRPGKYDLRKGDTLLDVIERAGGITDIAYAPGAIFTREAERRKQEMQFRSVARELDLAVAGYYMKQDAPQQHAEQIKVAQQIADELRRAEALGRITVEANPDTLRQNPKAAILMMPGDRVYIPRRPATVAVAGEVLSPTTLQYLPDMPGNDYIQQAGGTTRYADSGRSFVVFPDGSASPLRSYHGWNGQKGIPAGSTIIVPRDPEPLDFLKVTQSIGNILGNLAVTSIAISDIQRRR